MLTNASIAVCARERAKSLRKFPYIGKPDFVWLRYVWRGTDARTRASPGVWTGLVKVVVARWILSSLAPPQAFGHVAARAEVFSAVRT
jgi:hypothetical protein